jgi:membrane-bound ClpP family serine protease
VFYLFGVFLVIISAFIRTKKLQNNTLGEIISRIGLVLIMLGVFGPLGFSKIFYILTLVGIIFLSNKKSNTEEKNIVKQTSARVKKIGKLRSNLLMD